MKIWKKTLRVSSTLREGKPRGELADAPNKSLDVSAKQRLCYRVAWLLLADLVAVSRHVTSAVVRFVVKSTRVFCNTKMFPSGTPLSEQFFNGTRFQFLVLSRSAVETFKADAPYLVVSITDPEQPEAAIPESPFLRATLRMKFHDIAKPSRIAAQFDSGSTDVYATEADAEKILSFVGEHLAEVKLIVCHCEQGISRSAAIAAALSRILQNEDEFFFQHYWVNRYVYDLLLAKADVLKARTRTTNQWT